VRSSPIREGSETLLRNVIKGNFNCNYINVQNLAGKNALKLFAIPSLGFFYALRKSKFLSSEIFAVAFPSQEFRSVLNMDFSSLVYRIPEFLIKSYISY
jgi:hypothetical protein